MVVAGHRQDIANLTGFELGPQGGEGCAGIDGAFLVDEDDGAGGRTRNFTGPLSEAVGCAALIGTDGVGVDVVVPVPESQTMSSMANWKALAGVVPSAFAIMKTSSSDCAATLVPSSVPTGTVAVAQSPLRTRP